MELTQSRDNEADDEFGRLEGHDDRESSTVGPRKPVSGRATPNPPPNGGLQAWLQVVSSFFLIFNAWGLLNTFGVYQAYYESGQLFIATSSDISWIGSLQAYLMLLVGFVTGPVFDAGHLRLLLGFGTFGLVFGHMMLSLVHTYWQTLLAQALVIGIGAGCLYVPAVAVTPQYFDTKVATAMGLGVSGSSFGGIIYPILFNKLVISIGFPWAVRVIGFFALAVLAIPLFAMKMRVQPPAKRALFDGSAFKDRSMLTYLGAGFIGYVGLFVPIFYIPSTATTLGLAPQTRCFYLLPILNAASIFGRILPGFFADKFGPLNVFVPITAVTAVVAFCVIPVHTFGGMVVVSVFYGFWSGAYISLPPSIFVALTPPEKRHLLGTRIGMGFALMGIGLLIGTPVAGAIADSQSYFTGVYLLAGSTLAAGCVGFIALRVMRTGPTLMAVA